jgi:hypothetical protein
MRSTSLLIVSLAVGPALYDCDATGGPSVTMWYCTASILLKFPSHISANERRVSNVFRDCYGDIWLSFCFSVPSHSSWSVSAPEAKGVQIVIYWPSATPTTWLFRNVSGLSEKFTTRHWNVLPAGGKTIIPFFTWMESWELLYAGRMREIERETGAIGSDWHNCLAKSRNCNWLSDTNHGVT